MNTYGKRKKSIVPASVILMEKNKAAKSTKVKPKKNSSTTIIMAAFYNDQNEEPVRTMSTPYRDGIKTSASDLRSKAMVTELVEERGESLAQSHLSKASSHLPQMSPAGNSWLSQMSRLDSNDPCNNGFLQMSQSGVNNGLMMPNLALESETFVRFGSYCPVGADMNDNPSSLLAGHVSDKQANSVVPTASKPSKRRYRLSKSKEAGECEVQVHQSQAQQALPQELFQEIGTPKPKPFKGLNRRVREVFRSGKAQDNKELKVGKIFSKVKNAFCEDRSDSECKKTEPDDELDLAEHDSPVIRGCCSGTPQGTTSCPVSATKLRSNESDNLRKSKIQKINKHGDTLTENGDYSYHQKTSLLKRSKSLSFKMMTRRNKDTKIDKIGDAPFMENFRETMDPFTEDANPGAASRLLTSFEEKCKKPEGSSGDFVTLPLPKNGSHSFRAEIARMSQVKEVERTNDVSHALFSSSPIAESTPRCRLEPTFEEDGSSKLQRVPASMRSRFDAHGAVREESEEKHSEYKTPLYSSRRRPIMAMNRTSSQILENNEFGSESEPRAFLSPTSKAHPSPAHSVLEEYGAFFSSPESVTKEFGRDIPRNVYSSCFVVEEEDSLADSFSELNSAAPLSPKNLNELVKQIPGQNVKIGGRFETEVVSSGSGTSQGFPRQSRIPRPTSVYSIPRCDSRAMNLDGSAFDMDHLQRDDSEFSIATKRA